MPGTPHEEQLAKAGRKSLEALHIAPNEAICRPDEFAADMRRGRSWLPGGTLMETLARYGVPCRCRLTLGSSHLCKPDAKWPAIRPVRTEAATPLSKAQPGGSYMLHPGAGAGKEDTCLLKSARDAGNG